MNKKPMTLIVLSNDPSILHMALMMGASASAVGRPVTFFFSKYAVNMLTVNGWEKLTTKTGATGTEMDQALTEKNIADSAVLIDALAALDVRFIACETALKEHDIDILNLIKRPRVEIGGIAGILESGAGGDWLTF